MLRSTRMETQHAAGPRARTALARAGLGLLAAAILLIAGCSSSDDGIRITVGTGAEGTPPPGEATVAATPTPRPVPLPPRPENPFAGGVAVAQYLAGGRADIEGCLPELVREWGLEEEPEGPRCLSVNLDADVQDEWLFVINLPGSGDAVGLGDIWFFQDEADSYRYFNSARALANAAIAGAHVREVRDLTRDGFPDVVITWQACSDEVCETRLLIASQHHGTLQNLAPEQSFVESLEEFEISETGEIRMVGGASATAATGPFRPQIVTVSWAGMQFRREQQDAEPVYLIHLVNDADAAFARGDYVAARDLFLAAAADSTLRDWKQEQGEPAERGELRPYAHFRAALATLRAGDAVGMMPHLDRAIAGYEGTMHGSAANIYREALRQANTPEIACSAMESYLGTFQALYNEFWDYGPSVQARTVFTMCR